MKSNVCSFIPKSTQRRDASADGAFLEGRQWHTKWVVGGRRNNNEAGLVKSADGFCLAVFSKLWFDTGFVNPVACARKTVMFDPRPLDYSTLWKSVAHTARDAE